MSVLFAILLFSFLIFIHEFGHFLAAKLSGVQVNEFALFMGPAIFQKQVGETLYSIRTIPIGGYCAMEGEDEDTENPRSFQKAAWWKRLIILVAGSAMNFIAGVLIFAIVYMPVERIVVPVISSFETFSTVDGEYGLQVGDEIVELDGEAIYVYADFDVILSLNEGDVHDLVVKRGGERVRLDDLLMERHEVTDDEGNTRKLFGINFSYKELDFWGKLEFAWANVVDTVRNVRLSLQMLLTGKAGVQDVTGVVGIVDMMSDAATEAPNYHEVCCVEKKLQKTCQHDGDRIRNDAGKQRTVKHALLLLFCKPHLTSPRNKIKHIIICFWKTASAYTAVTSRTVKSLSLT